MAAFLPMLGEFIMTGIEGGVATGLATEAYNEFAPKVNFFTERTPACPFAT